MEPQRPRALDQLERLLGREPELRAVLARADRLVRLASTPSVSRTSAADTGRRGALGLLESVEHDQRARRAGFRELRVVLVVAVDDERVAADPCLPREAELAERRDVGAEPSSASSRITETFGNAFVP